MRIQNNTTTQSFNANPICKTVVKRRIPFTPFYKNTDATFVMLDRRYDVVALTHYVSSHPKTAITSDCIFDLRSDHHTNAFAITTQKSNFDDLEPGEILGVCDGRLFQQGFKKIFYLQNLETQSANNPNAVHRQKSQTIFGIEINYEEKYKNIGRKMLRESTRVLNRCEVDAIELTPFPTKRDFYTRLGFERPNKIDKTFSLSREKFQEFIEQN